MFNNSLCEVCAIYKIIWKNSALLNRLQMTMWPTHLAEEFQVSQEKPNLGLQTFYHDDRNTYVRAESTSTTHTVIRALSKREEESFTRKIYPFLESHFPEPPPPPAHHVKKQRVSCNTVSNQFTFFVTLIRNASHRRPIKISLSNNFPNNHKFLMEHRDRPNNGTAIITNLCLMSVFSKLKCYILN